LQHFSSEQVISFAEKRKALVIVTIIEIRPYRNGWQVYEAPGVQPVFLSKEQAIDYVIPGVSCNWEWHTHPCGIFADFAAGMTDHWSRDDTSQHSLPWERMILMNPTTGQTANWLIQLGF
jgi:hypothetical protein